MVLSGFWLLESFRTVLSAVVSLIFFSAALPEKLTKKSVTGGTVYVLAYAALVFFMVVRGRQIALWGYLAALTVNFLYLRWLKQCNSAKSLLLSTFCQAVLLVVVVVFLVLIRHVFHVSVKEFIMHTNSYAMFFLVTLKVLQLAALYGFSRLKYHLDYSSRPMLGLSCVLCVAMAALCVCIAGLAYRYDGFNQGIMQILILCMLFTLSSLLVVNSFAKAATDKMNLQMQAEQELITQKYLSDVSEMHESCLKMKHDMQNHLMVMNNLLQNGHLAQLEDYLRELNEENEALISLVNTGNVLIDAILNVKLGKANLLGIETSVKYFLPAEIQVSHMDMCIILGNLLDNATEACQKLETGRYISLTLKKAKKTFMIEVVNPTNGVEKKDGTRFLTTKSEGTHGMGLEQVERICQKYGGYFCKTHEANIFRVSVMLADITAPVA